MRKQVRMFLQAMIFPQCAERYSEPGLCENGPALLSHCASQHGTQKLGTRVPVTFSQYVCKNKLPNAFWVFLCRLIMYLYLHLLHVVWWWSNVNGTDVCLHSDLAWALLRVSQNMLVGVLPFIENSRQELLKFPLIFLKWFTSGTNCSSINDHLRWARQSVEDPKITKFYGRHEVFTGLDLQDVLSKSQKVFLFISTWILNSETATVYTLGVVLTRLLAC